MAHDPVAGPVSGPVNKKSTPNSNRPGKTSGKVPVTNARTRKTGAPTTGGNPPSAGGAAAVRARHQAHKQTAAKDAIQIDVLRPSMTRKRGSGPS